MKDPAAVALGKKRYKSKEEAKLHMTTVRAKRWNSKTDEEKKAVGQFLKEARERARLSKTHQIASETINPPQKGV